jgi:hypothetical protein
MLKKAVRAFRKATAPQPATDFWDRFRHLSGFEMEGSEREWQQLCLYTEMMHRLADVPGDIAEFGVGSGVSLLAFVRVNDVLQKGLDDRARRRIYGFDSFEGLPKLSSFDSPSSGAQGGVQMKEGGYSGAAAYASLVQYLAAHRNVTLLKGWFSQTLPPFLEKNQHVGFALVHVDCDLYESTRDCLSLVLPRVVPGGIVLFEVYDAGNVTGASFLAGGLGAKRLAQGLGNADRAFAFDALPRVQLLLLFWDRQEDFPARAALLVDRGLLDYLDQEASVFLAEAFASRLLGKTVSVVIP